MNIMYSSNSKIQIFSIIVKYVTQNFYVDHTSCSTPGVIPESFHKSLDISEFLLKVLVTDYSWTTCNIAQYFLKFFKLRPMLIGSTLHQVVAGRTVNATTLTVILILLTAITPTAFHILQTLETKLTL